MESILKNALLPDGRTVNLHIKDGRIASIVPCDAPFDSHCDVMDIKGRLVLPAMVDAHIHLDKTVMGLDWFVNDLGPLIGDRIANERNMRYSFGVDPYTQSCRHIEASIVHGVLHARSHVDIDTVIGLKGLEGMLKAREKYRSVFDLEIVAFPQSGLVVRPGTRELMDEAMRMGCDIVGGLDPAAIDRDPAGSIRAVFDLAVKHRRPVDIHLHEVNELGGFSMELIAEATKANGMEGLVTVSHAFCLGSSNQAMVAGLLEKLADANIQIVTAAQPYSPGIPPVKQVLKAGINLCGGNDNIRDLWSPFGSGDMLERVQFIAMYNALRRDADIEECFGVCSCNGAALMNLSDYGTDEGCLADLMIVDARNITEAVVTHSKDRLVLRRGKPVAENGQMI